MIDAGLTKSQYTMMQQRGKKVGCSLLPSYKRVSKAKAACLPPQNAIAVEPDQARVKMQQLLNHTATRLLQLQAEVLSKVTTDFTAQLTLHSAVIDTFDLPNGMMSEEAAESLNKCIREVRLKHTRKDTQCPRLHTMSDMFGYLLVASDPVLSSVGQQERRRKHARRQGTLLSETLRLLADPALPAAGMVKGCDCPVEDGDSSESSSSSESDE
ncbi:hypothetical protein FJT64_000820 [Amphibalanus amphitrite]|uniref:Uncharacterized protein n=1 Tax=Amphibalanus amphitrite TaxID=1232801 RepID=A0A6A4VQ63_AMPAM|nr:hypothetical protein FJT64_000820 [Amphibalanus amphitrite]